MSVYNHFNHTFTDADEDPMAAYGPKTGGLFSFQGGVHGRLLVAEQRADALVIFSESVQTRVHIAHTLAATATDNIATLEARVAALEA
jgi:hypothetical protein